MDEIRRKFLKENKYIYIAPAALFLVDAFFMLYRHHGLDFLDYIFIYVVIAEIPWQIRKDVLKPMEQMTITDTEAEYALAVLKQRLRSYCNMLFISAGVMCIFCIFCRYLFSTTTEVLCYGAAVVLLMLMARMLSGGVLNTMDHITDKYGNVFEPEKEDE